MSDARNNLTKCPLCHKYTFRGDYAHEMFVDDNEQIKCTGVK